MKLFNLLNEVFVYLKILLFRFGCFFFKWFSDNIKVKILILMIIYERIVGLGVVELVRLFVILNILFLIDELIMRVIRFYLLIFVDFFFIFIIFIYKIE